MWAMIGATMNAATARNSSMIARSLAHVGQTSQRLNLFCTANVQGSVQLRYDGLTTVLGK
jgi:hypothetical protein